MDEDDKKRIQANYMALVRDLSVVEIVDYLRQYGVLTEEQMEEISLDRGITPQKSARLLIGILHKKPPNKHGTAFKIFCDALSHAKFGFLAELLMETDISVVDVSDEPDYDARAKIETLQAQLWAQTELVVSVKKELDKMKREMQRNKTENHQSKLLKLKVAMEEKGLTSEQVIGYIKEYDVTDDAGGFVDTQTSADVHVRQGPTYMDHAAWAEVGRSLRIKGDKIDPNELTRVEQIAKTVGRDIIAFMANSSEAVPDPPNTYCVTMRRLVAEISAKRGATFVELINRLELDSSATGFTALCGVADALFRMGGENWGRIVAFYAFGGWLAKYSVDQRRGDIVEAMGDYLGLYVAKHVGSWIIENGGWDGLIKFFSPDVGTDSNAGSVALGVLVVALGASLAAYRTFRPS